MLSQYKTILQEAECEIIEKKTRFIATVRPVQTEEEAKTFIEEMKKKYWNARHNVFAYQIGERDELQRFSDDGEPQGTAGMPVLSVLKGEEIKNTAIVVTRYFGGTLLGTGGLVRAYGKTAKQGLLKAGIVDVILYAKIQVLTEYGDSGKVQYEALQGEHIIQETNYTEKVEFIILTKVEKQEAFCKLITEVTKGQGCVEVLEEVYGAWINQQLKIIEK